MLTRQIFALNSYSVFLNFFFIFHSHRVRIYFPTNINIDFLFNRFFFNNAHAPRPHLYSFVCIAWGIRALNIICKMKFTIRNISHKTQTGIWIHLCFPYSNKLNITKLPLLFSVNLNNVRNIMNSHRSSCASKTKRFRYIHNTKLQRMRPCNQVECACHFAICVTPSTIFGDTLYAVRGRPEPHTRPTSIFSRYSVSSST